MQRPRKAPILDSSLSVQDYLLTNSESSSFKSLDVVVTSASSKSSTSSGSKWRRPEAYMNWFTLET